jgi:hypothetical protein
LNVFVDFEQFEIKVRGVTQLSFIYFYTRRLTLL